MTEVLRKPDGVVVIDPAGMAAHIPQEQIFKAANDMIQAWMDNREGKPFPVPKDPAGSG